MTQQRIQELEHQVAILTRLLEVNQRLNTALLNTSLKVEALLAYILDAAAELVDAEAGSILLWNNNKQELFFAATTTDNAHSKALIGKPVPLESIAGRIFKEKRAIQLDTIKEDSGHYDKVDQDIQFVTRSLLGVPLIAKQHVIGVLEVVNKRNSANLWSKEDEQYLRLLADEAALAIEVAQLVVALQKANREMSELDKLKNDFIAIASHELRTPLGIILGYAGFLQEEATDPEYGELASKVMSSALQLRKIIEDMLNLRYLKQKQTELNRAPVRLHDLIVDLESEALTFVEANKHTLHVSYPPKDLQVYVDASRINMALNNLMNNAARFTPEGGEIRVSWALHSTAEVWLSISDTGIGIEQNQLEKIFEDFYQVEDHMTRQYGGMGIGLSIARALLEAHGGRVWAESPGLGQGSTFTISLPLAK